MRSPTRAIIHQGWNSALLCVVCATKTDGAGFLSSLVVSHSRNTMQYEYGWDLVHSIFTCDVSCQHAGCIQPLIQPRVSSIVGLGCR
ncbi:hypothetical protein V8C42DRAFT_311586 [Trichoderma barbatum]